MSKIQLEVVRGEDRLHVVRVVFQGSTEPYPLTGWSKITAEFRQADRAILQKTSDLVNGAFATVTRESVVYTADIIGVGGNNILLVFDGAKDIDTVISEWNVANPTNTVSSDAADGSVVPSAGNAQLAAGVAQDPGDITVVNEATGKISIRLTDSDSAALKTGPNQSFRVLIDKGSHPNGERRIVLFDSALNVINADI